jgi:Na+-driven multidrug efflux pump
MSSLAGQAVGKGNPVEAEHFYQIISIFSFIFSISLNMIWFFLKE